MVRGTACGEQRFSTHLGCNESGRKSKGVLLAVIVAVVAVIADVGIASAQTNSSAILLSQGEELAGAEQAWGQVIARNQLQVVPASTVQSALLFMGKNVGDELEPAGVITLQSDLSARVAVVVNVKLLPPASYAVQIIVFGIAAAPAKKFANFTGADVVTGVSALLEPMLQPVVGVAAVGAPAPIAPAPVTPLAPAPVTPLAPAPVTPVAAVTVGETQAVPAQETTQEAVEGPASLATTPKKGKVVGVVAGANLGQMAYDEGDMDSSDTFAHFGFRYGAFIEIPLKENVILRASAIYSDKGGKTEEEGDTARISMDYIEVPVLAGYQKDKYTFYGGLSVAKFLSGDFEVTGDAPVDRVELTEVEDFDLGIVVGADMIFAKKFQGSLRYTHGISSVFSDTESSGSTPEVTHQVLSLFAGYRFEGLL